MTNTPAIGHDPDTTDSDQTRALRREMVTALVNDGTLTDDRWRDAFLAVPRHVLVPAYYQDNTQIDGETDRERWLRLVYSDTTLVTQRRPDAVTSSGTMPSLLATSIPPAWIDHTRTGGIVLAPLFSGLVTLTVTSPGHAEGRFIGPGYFMRHRATPNAFPQGGPLAGANESPWPERSTALPASVYYDTDFRFLLDLTMPPLSHGHPGGDLKNLILSAPDGSRAHVTPDGALTQSGPRRLWEDVETLHQTWRSLGTPPRERFGLTVAPQRQTIWLDTPDSDHRWPVG